MAKFVKFKRASGSGQVAVNPELIARVTEGDQPNNSHLHFVNGNEQAVEGTIDEVTSKLDAHRASS